MRTALLLLLALAAAAPMAGPAYANQIVWKWVDEKGVTHYSDRPVPGATKIEMNVGTGSPNSNPPASIDTTDSTQRRDVRYQNFEIVQPTNGESIVNTAGVVEVSIRVEPVLRRSHQLRLYLDGKPVDPLNVSSYTLREVPRGTHTVNAVITDRSGTQIQQTEIVSFTVRQESIASPPVGPALKPPPKPRTSAGNKLRNTQPTYAQLNGAAPKMDSRTNAPAAPKAKPKSNPKLGN